MNAITNKPKSNIQFYEELIEEHYDYILRYIQCRMADQNRAYDVAQDVFLTAWTAVEKLRVHPNAKAWLMRTSVYKMKHLFDKDTKENEAASAMAAQRISESSYEQDATRLLADLNAKEAAILLMFYVEEMSIVEIAESLGITHSAVKMRLSRARRKLEDSAKNRNFLKYFLLLCYLLTFFRDI